MIVLTFYIISINTLGSKKLTPIAIQFFIEAIFNLKNLLFRFKLKSLTRNKIYPFGIVIDENYNMKKTILQVILFLPVLAFNQVSPPELFLEGSMFFEEQFEPNAYIKISTGAELFSYKFVAPEIEVAYFAGGDVNEVFDADETGAINYKSVLSTDFDAVIWGFAPKIFYQLEHSRWVLIPKYHFGNLNGEASFFDSDDVKIEKQVKTKINFWSFSFGYEGKASPKNSNSPNLGIYLTYTGFNAGKVLNQFNFKDKGYHSDNYSTKAIGVSVRISTDFKKHSKKKD